MKILSLILAMIGFSSCCAQINTIKLVENEVIQKDNFDVEPKLRSQPSGKHANEVILKKTDSNAFEDGKKEITQTVKNLKEVLQENRNEPIDHSVFSELLQRYVSINGNVNYNGFRSEWKTLSAYIEGLNKNLPNEDSSRQEKLAYWINAYNAMTIDLILRNYPVKSIKDIKDPWKQRLWKLGDKWYNLDEIEHQIIRKMDEPRIHFALVCAAVSCPRLYNKAFTGENLENDLSKLTREFLTDTSKNSISENSLELSKIFQWFSKDFKQNGSLIDFLNQYSDVKISPKAKKRFKTYNWDLNE